MSTKWSWVGLKLPTSTSRRSYYSSLRRDDYDGPAASASASASAATPSSTRVFSVGDPVTVSGEDGNVWVAQILDFFHAHSDDDNDGDENDNDNDESNDTALEDAIDKDARRSANNDYALMRCTLRWFYSHTDLHWKSLRHNPDVPSHIPNEIYFSDHVEADGFNDIQVIEGRAWLFPRKADLSAFKKNPDPAYVEGSDKCCIVRCFVDSNSSQLPVRRLAKDELSHLIANPSKKKDLYFDNTRKTPTNDSKKAATASSPSSTKTTSARRASKATRENDSDSEDGDHKHKQLRKKKNTGSEKKENITPTSSRKRKISRKLNESSEDEDYAPTDDRQQNDQDDEDDGDDAKTPSSATNSGSSDSSPRPRIGRRKIRFTQEEQGDGSDFIADSDDEPLDKRQRAVTRTLKQKPKSTSRRRSEPNGNNAASKRITRRKSRASTTESTTSSDDDDENDRRRRGGSSGAENERARQKKRPLARNLNTGECMKRKTPNAVPPDESFEDSHIGVLDFINELNAGVDFDKNVHPNPMELLGRSASPATAVAAAASASGPAKTIRKNPPANRPSTSASQALSQKRPKRMRRPSKLDETVHVISSDSDERPARASKKSVAGASTATAGAAATASSAPTTTKQSSNPSEARSANPALTTAKYPSAPTRTAGGAASTVQQQQQHRHSAGPSGIRGGTANVNGSGSGASMRQSTGGIGTTAAKGSKSSGPFQRDTLSVSRGTGLNKPVFIQRERKKDVAARAEARLALSRNDTRTQRNGVAGRRDDLPSQSIQKNRGNIVGAYPDAEMSDANNRTKNRGTSTPHQMQQNQKQQRQQEQQNLPMSEDAEQNALIDELGNKFKEISVEDRQVFLSSIPSIWKRLVAAIDDDSSSGNGSNNGPSKQQQNNEARRSDHIEMMLADDLLRTCLKNSVRPVGSNATPADGGGVENGAAMAA